MKNLKFNNVLAIFISLVAIFLMTSPVYAESINNSTENEQTTEIHFDEEIGMYYVELSTQSANDDMQTVYDTITALPGGYYTSTGDIVAQHSKVSAAVRGDTSGIQVAVQLKVKIGSNYYNVTNGYNTFTCNGSNYNVFQGLKVDTGKTYRFYFKSLGGNTDAPNLIIAATFWD